jgi:hypothetical protein
MSKSPEPRSRLSTQDRSTDKIGAVFASFFAVTKICSEKFKRRVRTAHQIRLVAGTEARPTGLFMIYG